MEEMQGSATTATKQEYDASNIRVLEGLEAVRRHVYWFNISKRFAPLYL